MKRFKKVICLFLTVFTMLGATPVFAMDSTIANDKVSTRAAIYQRDYKYYYYTMRNIDIKLGRLTAGTAKIAVPTVVVETWEVDQWGNQLNMIAKEIYVDPNKSGYVDSYAGLGGFNVSVKYISQDRSKVVVETSASHKDFGNSMNRVNVYPAYR